MSESVRRRRRPAVSCTLCRKRKIRCNRELPCNNCSRSSKYSCEYASPPHAASQSHSGELDFGQRALSTGEDVEVAQESTIVSLPARGETGSRSASTPTSQSSAWDLENMKRRVAQLEDQLSKVASSSASVSKSASVPCIETTNTSLGGTIYYQRENKPSSSSQPFTRGVVHKKLLFGQSHWSTVAVQFQNVVGILEPSIKEDKLGLATNMQRAKALARIVKQLREPAWPSPPTAELPSKAIVDELVDCYLRTTERIYRVLHVPTFREEYNALWAAQSEPDMAFVIQLKLVLAIGAVIYDETFSLRATAIRWVYEALAWFSAPKAKSRTGIQTLQINTLLLIAREVVGVDEESNWIGAGALLRAAMSMGLHRDPMHLPEKTILAREMRRRLWNTVLEITLQTSLTFGGPTLLSMDDFDTLPPQNYDDEQLTVEGSAPKPENEFTQTSIAIALRKTFPLRLAINKLLNDLSSRRSYEETLRLDTELRAAYKLACKTLQTYKSNNGPKPSRFDTRFVDVLIQNHLSSLHLPYIGLAFQETAYAFSRKVVVDASLKLWYAACPPSPVPPVQSPNTASNERDDYVRLVCCGSGFFRIITRQAAWFIALELRRQLQEEQGLEPTPLRPDLVAVLEDGKSWCLRCIEAGQTNIKGHMIVCMMAAEIDGLVRGMGKEEIAQSLVDTVAKAQDTCLSILEKLAGQGQAQESSSASFPSLLGSPSTAMQDWNMVMPDILYGQGNAEQMYWMYDDSAMQNNSFWG